MNEHKLKRLFHRFENNHLNGKGRLWVRRFLQFYQTKGLDNSRMNSNQDSLLKEVEGKIMQHAQNNLFQNSGKMISIPNRIKYNFLKIAATLILLIIGPGLAYYFNNAYTRNAVVWMRSSAAKGTTLHLVLSDSSEVWLNSGTTIRYPNHFQAKIREVFVEEGEAYFKINHIPTKEFLVHNSFFTTKDIGTSFTISSYKKSPFAKVAVYSGRVALEGLSKAKQPFYLSKGEKIIYTKNNRKVHQSNFSFESETQWINGDLRFENEALVDILISLENRFDIQIDCKDKLFKLKQISTSFSTQSSPQLILSALCKFTGRNFTTISPKHFSIY